MDNCKIGKLYEWVAYLKEERRIYIINIKIIKKAREREVGGRDVCQGGRCVSGTV